MGIFGRQIKAAYAPTNVTVPLAVASPWSPTDTLTQWTVDQLFRDEIENAHIPMTRDMALRIPSVKRAHRIHVSSFAEVPFFLMDNTARVADQPAWLTSSRSGVSPYHRMHGLGSDMFFNGWGCLGFDRDPRNPNADCLHVPFGAWGVDPKSGQLWVNTDIVPDEYARFPIAIPVGYGENGLLVDGIDTLREARAIEVAYQKRLDDPVPLTVLGIPRDDWQGMTPEERREYRDQWVEGRRKSSTALKVAEWPVDMPGQIAVDLYESGRNAVRLDIANHTNTPASMLEGTRQAGGGGTDIRYTGVANGTTRNELWEFGSAKAFTLAFEARMSLDDICPPGLSIRGDLSAKFSYPEQPTNPTSED